MSREASIKLKRCGLIKTPTVNMGLDKWDTIFQKPNYSYKFF